MTRKTSRNDLFINRLSSVIREENYTKGIFTMKKNTMMRVATVLMVAVLLTTCAISGTFAKYTTAATSEDSARVAYWGFDNTATIDIDDLFKNAYDSTVQSTVDVIAPGTQNSATFQFTYNEANATAPEVAYDFTVSVDGSYCDTAIANNANIQWSLDGGAWGDWGTLLNNIKLLSGDASGTKQYAPGQLPTAFTTADNTHTVAWQWIFSTDASGDALDTGMGNAADLADVKLVITINATQVD